MKDLPTGDEIGIARAYDFYLENGSYGAAYPESNNWNISLFDVQLYTTLTINEVITLDTPSRIIGENSGAKAFLRTQVTDSRDLTLYGVEGEFVPNEPIKIIHDANPNDDHDIENFERRYITSVRRYGFSDVKSIFSRVSGVTKFNADVVQEVKTVIGSATIGANLVVSIDQEKISKIKVGDIVSFTSPSESYPTYAKIASKATTTVTIAAVQSVPGVNQNSLPTSELVVSDFKILESRISKTEYTGNPADNNSLLVHFQNQMFLM